MISGGLFHGIQLWVNLPSKDKMIAPAYQNIVGGDVALLASADGGSLLRVIAGLQEGDRILLTDVARPVPSGPTGISGSPIAPVKAERAGGSGGGGALRGQ